MKTEKENIDEALENYANEKSSNELPSNFTHLMMQKIEQEAIQKSQVKRRLVSPLAWIIFGGFATLITLSLMFGDFSNSDMISLPEIDLDKHLDKIQLAVATIFAIASLALLDKIYRRRTKRQH